MSSSSSSAAAAAPTNFASDGDSDSDSDSEDFTLLNTQWVEVDELVMEASKHRNKETDVNYERALEKFKAYLRATRGKDECKQVWKLDLSEVPPEWKIDYHALAKSLISPNNMYNRYTLYHQARSHADGKSGLGHISSLRAALMDGFDRHKIELPKLATRQMKKWQKSRTRADMQAKTRSVNPIKFSHARDSLPFPAYKMIAKEMSNACNPFLWTLFVLQWNMIARVTNAAKLAFVHLNWSNDHMTARCSKSKKDQEGKRAFPMAFMANRYMWTICPITALAIWFSVTTYTPGANMVFPGNHQSNRYSIGLRAFLARPDVQTYLNTFTKLLLGSHSARKGATNHAASGSLIAGVLMSVLLRGQWDIGDTLKRYFKEHQDGDACVARLLAGLDIFGTEFAALPPHFRKMTRQMQSLVNAQFPTNPLNKAAATGGQGVVLQMCFASLLHHHDEIVRDLDPSHPLLATPLFTAEESVRAVLKEQLGPEIGVRGTESEHAEDDPLTCRGLPAHTVYMLDVHQKHQASMKRFDEVDKQLINIVKQLGAQLALLKKLSGQIQGLRTHGTSVVGPVAIADAVKDMLHKYMRKRRKRKRKRKRSSDSDSDSADESESDSDDSSSSSDSSRDGEDASTDCVAAAEVLDQLPSRKLRPHYWFHEWETGQPGIRGKQLPKDYKIPKLSLAGTMKLFLSQSGSNERPVPALGTIAAPKKQFYIDTSRLYFSKCRTVVKVMMQFMEKDEAGRTLIATFENAPSVTSLNALCTEAQKRFLAAAPPSKKKRGRLEATMVSTANNWCRKIREREGWLKTNKKQKTS